MRCQSPHYPPKQEGFANWHTWELWSRPLIDQAGRDLGFFDYHAYGGGTEPQTVAFALEIVTAQAMHRHGYHLRTIISEANTNYRIQGDDREVLSRLLRKRTIGWERYLWTLLRHRDKVLGSLWHDLGGPFSIMAGPHKDGYWVYWIFRNLRGDALWTVAPDPALPALASLEDNRATVVVYNDLPTSRQVHVKLRLSEGAVPDFSADRLEWDLKANAGQGEVLHEPLPAEAFTVKRIGNEAVVSWVARPWATYTIYATFPERPAPTKVVKQQEFFSDTVMSRLNAEKPTAVVEVNVDGRVLEQAGQVLLRVGLLDVARDGQLTIQAVKWKAAARKGLMENYEFPAPFIKAGRNRLTVSAQFEKDDHDILIGYVSAVVVSKRISLK